MVTRRKLTADRFLSSPRSSAQPQQPQGQDHTPPLSPPHLAVLKRSSMCWTKHFGSPVTCPQKLPPSPRPSRRITIQEPMSGPRPAAWGGIEVASSSLTVPNWQPTFTLSNEPLPASASIRTWDKGEGGRVAQSLVHGVLLSKDIQFFSDGSKESIAW